MGGGFHLGRLLDRINSLPYASHRTRVTHDIRADLAWWLAFMDLFNGTTCMVDTRPTDPMTIDAWPVAAGGHYLGNVCYTPWQLAWPSAVGLHINHKEVLALESAARAWGPLWANKRIHVYCDNTCAVYTINKSISKQPLVMASLCQVLSAIYNFRIKAVYYPGAHNILADCAFRLQEQGVWQKLGLALSNTCYGLPAYWYPLISCQMFSDPHESTALKLALQSEVAIFTSRAYADNTNRAYRTHRRSYLAFCTYMGYNPVPATSEVVCHYAASLARSLCFSSIKKYLNISRILHSEWNMPNPTLDNYNLQCVLKGIKRKLGASTSRKAAIKCMLVLMLAHLNLHCIEDCAILDAMQMIYYGMLRVAGVLCGGSYLQLQSPRDPWWYTLETWGVRCNCQAYQDYTTPRTDTGDSFAPCPRQCPVPRPGDGPVFTTCQCRAACTRPTFSPWPHPWWPSPYIPHLQPLC